jgi:ribosome-binding factor A
MSQHPRSLRLADQIQLEISDIIRNKLRDPRKGFITITGVEVSGDLRSARVFVSALGDPDDLHRAIELLDHARGFIRSELGSRIRARFIPEITFKPDDSAARGIRIDKLLDELKRGSPAGDEGKGEG